MVSKIFNRYIVSAGEGEKLLAIDGGDGCNVNILNTTELYTYVYYDTFYAMYILPQ